MPKAYGSAFDPLTGRFVLVLEDLAVDDCEFPDTLHPLDRDQAGAIVELLARLHATFWGRPPGWLYTASADSASLLTGPLLKTSARRIAERTDIPVEDGRFIDVNYRAVARLIDTPPHTVMHGDAHPGNVYFRNGEAGLLDWQAVRRGHPSRELAYTLITSMTTADRQACERELLDDYRRALGAAGGPELDCDELWDRYRQGARIPTLRRPSCWEWVACSRRPSLWRVCDARSPRSETSTRSRCLRSHCDQPSRIIWTKRLRSWK